MKRFKIFTIRISFVLGGAFALGLMMLVIAGILFQQYGKSYLEKKLPSNISIQSTEIRYRFPNSITFSNIDIITDHPAKINKLTFRLEPWRGYVAKIEIEGLNLTINHPNKKIIANKKTLNFPVTIPLDIHARDVKIKWKGNNKQLKLPPFDIKGGLSKNKLSLNIVNENNEWGIIKGNFITDITKIQKGQVTLQVQHIPIHSLKKILNYSPIIQSLRGGIEVSFQINGNWTEDWSGSIKPKRLTIVPSKSGAKIPIRGNVDINPNNIDGQLSINRIINISGKINQPFTARELDLKVHIEKGRLNRFLTVVGLSKISNLLAGSISANASVKGVMSNPKVDGFVNIHANEGSLKLPEIRGNLRLINKEIIMNSDIANGNIYIRKTIFDKSSEKTIVNISNINLGRIAYLNKWSNVSGTAHSQLVVDPDLNYLQARGKFTLENFTWGRNKKQGVVEGSISYDTDRVSIETEDGSLQLNCEREGQVVSINNFSIRFSSWSSLIARGEINNSKDIFRLAITGQNIQPDIWPPLVHRYPAITGALDFNGVISGSFKNPSGNLSIVSHNLTFIPGGGIWNGTTNLIWDRDNLSLKNLSVDGGYSGDVFYSRRKELGSWDIQVLLQNANPRLVWDIAKSTQSVAGWIDGEVKLKIKNQNITGTSSVTWNSGEVNKFYFDRINVQAKTNDGRIYLKEASIIKGPRLLRTRGTITKDYKNWRYDLEGHIQQWLMGGTYTLDGEIQSKGLVDINRNRIQAEFKSPVLWINNISFQNPVIKANQSRGKLSLKGRASNNIKFNFDLNRKTKSIRGNFNGENINLKEIGDKLLGVKELDNFESGSADLDLDVKGTIENPIYLAKINLKKSKWRGEKLNSRLILNVVGSTVNIVSSRTVLDRGGTFFARGSIDLTTNGKMKINGAGTGLELNSVFNILRWPTKWNGKSDVTFLIEGPKDNREIEIVFDGEHNGIGPFHEGGAISGAITGRKAEWNLEGIRIDSGNGFVQLAEGSKIFLEKGGDVRMRLLADTRNLGAGVLVFFGQVELIGSRSKNQIGDGQEEFSTEFDVFARSLWINQFNLNGNISHVKLSQGKIEFSPILKTKQRLSGSLDYSKFPDIEVNKLTLVEGRREKLFLDGYVGAPKWNFRLRVRDIDADVIRGLLDTNLPMTGPMDMRVQGRGSINNPKISATVTWRDGKFGILPVDSAICQVLYDLGVVELNNIYAIKKNGYIARGNVRFGKNTLPEIDLNIQKGNFQILQEMWSDVQKSKGSFSGQFSITGSTDSNRSVSGYLTADNLYLKSTSYIPKMTKGRLEIKFEDDELKVIEGRAKLTNGVIQLTGHVEFDSGYPETYNLSLFTLRESGVSIRIPELAIPPGPLLTKFSLLNKKFAGISRGEPVFNFSLTGTESEPLIKGVMRLENTVFTYPPLKDKGKKKKRFNILRQWLDDLVSKATWDIKLETGNKTTYENKLVQARVDGKINFLGATDDLDINGKISSTRGALVYAGNEFELVEATVEIITDKPKISGEGEKEILVYLQTQAKKEVYYSDSLGNSNQDTIIMDVDRSLLGQIKPRFRSSTNVGLSSERALQLALGIPLSGNVTDDDFLQDPNSKTSNQDEFDRYLRTGLVQLLDSSLATPMTRALARQTGLVDFIRVTYQEEKDDSVVDPSELESGSTGSQPTKNEWAKYMKGTKVKMGREISGGLTADYSFRVDERQNEIDLRHEVELAYKVHKSFYLRAISELDSERTLGRPPDRRALIENRWRFGRPKPKKPKGPSKSTSSKPAPPEKKDLR